MGILEKFSLIIKSNVNDLLDRATDPEKMSRELLREYTEDLAEVKKQTTEIMANEKAAKRKVDDLAAKVAEYEQLAMKAVNAGNDGDAKTFLTKKNEFAQQLATAQTAYKAAHTSSVQMRQMHDKLVENIQELKNRQSNIKAMQGAAKAQETVNKMTAKDSTSAITGAFDEMEQRAQARLDAAQAAAELNEEPTDEAAELAAKYGAGSDLTVDEELAALKAKMGKTDAPEA